MDKTVGQQIIEILSAFGVQTIYGIPANTTDAITEALRKQKNVRYIIMRHEESGAFAAAGEAKLTGKLAVCMGCQGPGAVHLLNGLYDAKTDHVPVLAITGQLNQNELGTHMPQEINLLHLFEDVSVFNEELRTPETAGQLLTQACQAAINERGVAHVSVPMNVSFAKALEWPIEKELIEHRYHLVPDEDLLQQAADLMNRHQKIAILYGEGARHAAPQLLALAKQLNAPLVHTTRSKDIIDNRNEYYVGGIGFMGSISGNYAIEHCDLLLVVGSAFAFKEFYPEHKPIIQIDVDPDRLGGRVPVTVGLAGNAADVLDLLNPKITSTNKKSFMDALQNEKEKTIKHNDHVESPTPSNKPIHPQALTRKISDLAPNDTIYCVDAGSVSFWGNNHLTLNGKQRFMWSTNLGSLGFGLTSAIGAQFAYPDRRVIVLSGDGGFDMLVGDFATQVKYNLPIVNVVYNNSEYAFIELEQETQGFPVFGTKFKNPNYADLAKAYGGDGIKVTAYDELEDALKTAFKSKVPFIIDVLVNPKELYIPPVFSPKMAAGFAESMVKTYVDETFFKGKFQQD